MVDLVVKRLECRLELGEIHDPAEMRIRLAGHMQLDPERMAVHARAFVPVWHVGQPVRGLDGEDLEDVHDRHPAWKRKTPPGAGLRAAPMVVWVPSNTNWKILIQKDFSELEL